MPGPTVTPPGSIQILRDSVALSQVQAMAESQFGDLVKAVVDVESAVMAIGGELHADEEALLLEEGSIQANLWGINLYPAQYGELAWIEFDSMINLRPSQGNRSRSVESPETQRRIIDVVGQLVRADD